MRFIKIPLFSLFGFAAFVSFCSVASAADSASAAVPDVTTLRVRQKRLKWGRVEKTYYFGDMPVAGKVLSSDGGVLSGGGMWKEVLEKDGQAFLPNDMPAPVPVPVNVSKPAPVEPPKPKPVAAKPKPDKPKQDKPAQDKPKAVVSSEKKERTFHWLLEPAFYPGSVEDGALTSNVWALSGAITRGSGIYNRSSCSISENPGYGVRAGFSKQLYRLLAVGLAFDYVREGEQNYNMMFFSRSIQGGAGDGAQEGKISGTLLRFTTFLSMEIPLGSKYSFRFRPSAGIARVSETDEGTYSGTLAGVMGATDYSYTDSFTGFTWDASFGLNRKLGNMAMEIGARYSEVRNRMTNTKLLSYSNESKFHWAPISFYLALWF